MGVGALLDRPSKPLTRRRDRHKAQGPARLPAISTAINDSG
jgi:hypothetical protein